MNSKKKITVVGSGYVGMSLAVLLAQHNEVIILDVDHTRVELVNRKKSTVADREIAEFLRDHELVELPPSDRTVGCRLMEAADELTG